jgi:hypothetical protein
MAAQPISSTPMACLGHAQDRPWPTQTPRPWQHITSQTKLISVHGCPDHGQLSQWPSRALGQNGPCADKTMASTRPDKQMASRALESPDFGLTNTWSAQSMAQPSPCPAQPMSSPDHGLTKRWQTQIIARPPHVQPIPFSDQTKSSSALDQTSQWATQPLVSQDLARAAHDQTGTCPDQTLNCPGQPMSSGYHGQNSPDHDQWSSLRPHPIASPS